MVKNLRSDAGDMGLTPGRGTQIPHDAGKPRNSCTTAREACGPRATMKTQHNSEKERKTITSSRETGGLSSNRNLCKAALQGEKATDSRGNSHFHT